MAKDWRVIIDDTGGTFSGWPSVWSDTADYSAIHQNGFTQKYWTGPNLNLAKKIARVVADYLNEIDAQ